MSNTTKFSEEELNQLRNLFPSDNNITDSIEEVSETVPEADSQITRTVGQGFFFWIW